MQFSVVAVAFLASLAMGNPLEERLPPCSEKGGKCDHRLFFCCQGQNLICVSVAAASTLTLRLQRLHSNYSKRVATEFAANRHQEVWKNGQWISATLWSYLRPKYSE